MTRSASGALAYHTLALSIVPLHTLLIGNPDISLRFRFIDAQVVQSRFRLR
jgi:hypothetical protein